MKGKALTGMTLDELWHIFPIQLVEHRAEWAEVFAGEASLVSDILDGKSIVSISHIGSTAVEGIWAKPIVDLLVEIDRTEDIREISGMLVSEGYICMSESDDRISLNKGYTPDGFADKVFHIHLRYEGDNAEIRFRDILRIHPDIAKEYEKLKLSLWRRFEFNRDAYTDGKTDFISSVMGAFPDINPGGRQIERPGEIRKG